MRAVILSLLLTLCAGLTPAFSQSSLKPEQKAVLVFDIRIDMLNSSPLGQQMKFSDLMSEAQERSGRVGADPSKLVRLFGAVSAPKSMAEIQEFEPGGEIPIQFFLRAKYQDSESAKTAMEHTLEDSAQQIDKNGRTFYKTVESGKLPAGLLVHQVDETTLELGTEAYVFHPDRKVLTDNLQTAWSKAPNEAIRLAMDVKGAQALVADLVEEGKKNADPVSEAYLDLIGNISRLGISIDLTAENLLSLRATALDAEKGQQLKDGLDSVLLSAQLGGRQVLPFLEAMAPDMKPVAESILDSLAAKIDGTDVSVVIPKPSGFEDAIGAAAAAGQIPLGK